MPETARPQATSARVAATKPTRSGSPRRTRLPIVVLTATARYPAEPPSMRSTRLPQHVSHSAQGVQQPLLPRVDLAPQIRHVGLDDIDVAAEVVAPDMVEDLGFAQYRARVDHEVAKQCEFGRRQRHRLAGLPYLVGLFVEFDIGKRQTGIAGLPPALAGASEYDPQPGDNLLQAERFRHVVVAAQGQAGDLVLQ